MKPMTVLWMLVAITFGIGIWLSISLAHADEIAQMPVICGHTDQWEANLANKYKEHPSGGGLTNGGNLVRIFQSEHTWTMVFSRPDGSSCTIAAGEDWHIEKTGNPI
jgi:hypothetical protein